MPVIEEEVFIPRPREEAFAYLTRAENLPVWDSSIMEAEQLGNDPIDVGTRWRGVSKILGRRFEWTTEVTEYEPPIRMTGRTVEGTLHFHVTNTFEEKDGGTRYIYRVEADTGLGGVFGKLADPFVEMAQRRTVRANLDTLVELLGQA
jgi:uncharacterized membrane protein